MTVKEIKNDNVRNIIKIAIAKKFTVTLVKKNNSKEFNSTVAIRIKKEDSTGIDVLKELILDSVKEIENKLDVSILRTSIILFDD